MSQNIYQPRFRGPPPRCGGQYGPPGEYNGLRKAFENCRRENLRLRESEYQLRSRLNGLLVERSNLCHKDGLVALREEMESKYMQLEKRYEKLEQENKILEDGNQLDMYDLKEKLEAYTRIEAENEYQDFLRQIHLEEVQSCSHCWRT